MESKFKWKVFFYSFVVGGVGYFSGICIEKIMYPYHPFSLGDKLHLEWLFACVVFSIILSISLVTKNYKIPEYLFIISSVVAILQGLPSVNAPVIFLIGAVFAVTIPLLFVFIVGIRLVGIFQTTENRIVKKLIFYIPLLLAPIAGYFFAF